MELQVRKLQESDWNLIPKWWEAYDEKILPRDMLPGSFKVGDKQEEKRKGLGGFMVCKGDDPIAAMWLWMTNSSMAIPAAIVDDKSYCDIDKDDALQLLINFTTDFAKDLGYKYSYSICKDEMLLEKYKKADYNVNSISSCELMIKYK